MQKGRWINLFSYTIREALKDSSRLFTVDRIDDNRNYIYPGKQRGKFRSYDKIFNSAKRVIGSHVLEITDVTAADLGTYKIGVYVLSSKRKSEEIIELRHRGRSS